METSSRLSIVLSLLGVIWQCSQGPTRTINGTENGRTDGVKTSEGTRSSDSPSPSGQEETESDDGNKNQEPSIVNSEVPELDCLGSVFVDSTGIAPAAQQKTLSYNGLETSLCNLVRIKQGSASIIHQIPAPCGESCLETALNLGLAHRRSGLNKSLTLIFIFNSQNQEASSTLMTTLGEFGIQAVIATDFAGQTARNLANINDSLTSPEFIAMTPGLAFGFIADSYGLYLEIVDTAEILAKESQENLVNEPLIPVTEWTGTGFQANGFIDLVSLSEPLVESESP